MNLHWKLLYASVIVVDVGGGSGEVFFFDAVDLVVVDVV